MMDWGKQVEEEIGSLYRVLDEGDGGDITAFGDMLCDAKHYPAGIDFLIALQELLALRNKRADTTHIAKLFEATTRYYSDWVHDNHALADQ